MPSTTQGISVSESQSPFLFFFLLFIGNVASTWQHLKALMPNSSHLKNMCLGAEVWYLQVADSCHNSYGISLAKQGLEVTL